MLSKLILIFLLLPVFGYSQFYDDTWGGADKFAHFSYCTGISYFTGAITQDVFKFKYGYEVGIAAAIGIGIWKETTDAQPSYQDLTYNVLGAFAGYALNRVYQSLTTPKTIEQRLAKEEKFGRQQHIRRDGKNYNVIFKNKY